MLTFVEKNSQRSNLADILPLSSPLGICIEPTNLCNFRCVQCPVSLPEFNSIVGERGDMDIDLYVKILNDINKIGKLRNLNLYGDGEPLLNKNIVEMVNLAVKHDVADKITITTNASLLNEEISYALINSGLSYLRVSIYSVLNHKFKLSTKSNYTPEAIYNNICNFKKIRDNAGKKYPHLYVKMIDTYDEEVDNFKKIYSEVADELNIETPMNWNGYNNYDFIGTIDPNLITDQTLIQGFYKEHKYSGLKKICTTAFHSLNIKQNGDVVICIVDWNKGTKVGNLRYQSLEEIWFGQELRNFRKMHISGQRALNSSCKNCNYLYGNPDNIDDLTAQQYDKILN